jgi:DNA-binding LacI/PurR family transcriptional regulator
MMLATPRVGATLLYRLLDGQPLDATRVELSTRLVVRESTAPPPSR